MGSVRGGLTFTLVPGAAWADVCDKERPLWDGAPVSAVGEAIGLFTTPAGVFLIAATALALALRSQWGGLVAVLLWTGFITFVTMADPGGLRSDAMIEGCIGSPTLFIAAVAAICVGTVLYTMPRQRGD
ncbi:MAG: hypothetical protein AAF214_11680 [Pseudomonadota bacterium]